MAVAARFRINRLTMYAHAQGDGPAGEVQLTALMDRGNEAWARYTPSGEITMNVNGPAYPWFQERLGEVLAITFDDVKETESRSVSAGGEG